MSPHPHRHPRPEIFPEILVTLRKARGLSQKALAISAGMDQSYVAGLENGRRPPPRDRQIARLAQALQASPKEHARLLEAKTASLLARVSAEAGGPHRDMLTQLIMIASRLSATDIAILDRIAGAMCCSSNISTCEERHMSP